MYKLIFATNNQHKVEEIKMVIGDLFKVVSLKEAGIDIVIPEPHDTLEANAREKSQAIFQLTGENCFAEDTGLEVAALNGEPGVKSARYAGEGRNFQENINEVLLKMGNTENRKARFRTVISLLLDGIEHQFEGICEGTILRHPKGKKGFGYDPIFSPTGEARSFAEMTMEEKNTFSHRKKATAQLLAFLSLAGKNNLI
jgi:XTP/dITP diphosphohydrolase